jgi:protein SCO1/2
LKNVLRLSALLIIFSCSNNNDKSDSLPILGEKDIFGKDTIYNTIPAFRFLNQDSVWITEENYSGVYIADFFYSTCPGICPIMTKEMVRVQKFIQDNKLDVKILSHSVDPENDSPKILKEYAQKKGANLINWNFVTGDKKAIYEISYSYLITALEDLDNEHHFVHSEYFILIDKEKRVRGLYDGTNSTEVDKLMKDLQILMQ